MQNALTRLRTLGCRIALDDFGTGYSSLAYITRFLAGPHQDRQGIRARCGSHGHSDAAIANAILSLAASLDLVVTAEGVERGGQLEWLRERGCHEVQGFLLARPATAAELEAKFFFPPPRAAEDDQSEQLGGNRCARCGGPGRNRVRRAAG